MEHFFNILSALAAFAAAGLWFWSTRVEVEYVEPESSGGWKEPALLVNSGEKTIDPFRTGFAQARWNRWAALAAAIAALCQGIGTLLS